MILRGAVFDADGTLLDSMPLWASAASGYLNSLGIPCGEEVDRQIRSMSLHQGACWAKETFALSLSVEELEAGVNRRIARAYREEIPLKPGAAGFLRLLRERNVRICIATATGRRLIEAAFRRCGVLECFDRIFTCGEVGSGKDVPVIYERALEYLGTGKRDTLVFEDALYALRTAKAAGFPVVGVADSSNRDDRDALMREADIWLDSFARPDVLLKFLPA